MIAGGYGQILILLSAKPNPSYAQLSTEIIAVPLPPVLCVRQMMCLFDNIPNFSNSKQGALLYRLTKAYFTPTF